LLHLNYTRILFGQITIAVNSYEPKSWLTKLLYSLIIRFFHIRLRKKSQPTSALIDSYKLSSIKGSILLSIITAIFNGIISLIIILICTHVKINRIVLLSMAACKEIEERRKIRCIYITFMSLNWVYASIIAGEIIMIESNAEIIPLLVIIFQ